MNYLDRLLDERTSLTGVMTGLRDRAAAEERDLTDAERSEIARLQERCVEVDGLLTEHHAQTESARAFAELQSRIETSRETSRQVERRAPAPVERTSFGQVFVESEEFRTYAGRGESRALPLEGYTPVSLLETRAPIDTGDLAIQNVVVPPNVVQIPVPPLLTVVNTVRVSSGTVSWVTVTGDPVAGVVAEGTAKPEAALTFTPTTSALDTLAHWIAITRQALQDAPYIRSLVEGKLRRGLALKIAADIMVNLVGATLPTATVPVGGELIEAIRVGIGTVQSAGYQPNAVLLNPADYAALDMAVMGATVNGPVVGSSYWGLRPIADAAQPAGTATVGDFNAGVTYFDRGVADVFISDSHASNFISNILVILAETRGKSAVTDVGALCECSVSAT